jgi:hypothetical protein
MTTVFCLVCGAELRREPDPAATNYPAFEWFDLAGARADNCPRCRAVTSLLNTAPAPSPTTVARLVQSLHFLCVAVRCGYSRHMIVAEGYFDTCQAALREAGWDPDQELVLPPRGADLRG